MDYCTYKVVIAVFITSWRHPIVISEAIRGKTRARVFKAKPYCGQILYFHLNVLELLYVHHIPLVRANPIGQRLCEFSRFCVYCAPCKSTLPISGISNSTTKLLALRRHDCKRRDEIFRLSFWQWNSRWGPTKSETFYKSRPFVNFVFVRVPSVVDLRNSRQSTPYSLRARNLALVQHWPSGITAMRKALKQARTGGVFYPVRVWPNIELCGKATPIISIWFIRFEGR